MTTGERIRAARLRAGLTQQELAEKIGISYQGIGQWERDARKPKIETLSKIADALDVPVGYFMGQDNIIEVARHKMSTREALQELLTDTNIDVFAKLLGTTPEIAQGLFDVNDSFDARIMLALLYQIASTLPVDDQDGDTLSELEKSRENLLLSMFRKLNDDGKAKVLERVEELTELQKYRA